MELGRQDASIEEEVFPLNVTTTSPVVRIISLSLSLSVISSLGIFLLRFFLSKLDCLDCFLLTSHVSAFPTTITHCLS